MSHWTQRESDILSIRAEALQEARNLIGEGYSPGYYAGKSEPLAKIVERWYRNGYARGSATAGLVAESFPKSAPPPVTYGEEAQKQIDSTLPNFEAPPMHGPSEGILKIISDAISGAVQNLHTKARLAGGEIDMKSLEIETHPGSDATVIFTATAVLKRSADGSPT